MPPPWRRAGLAAAFLVCAGLALVQCAAPEAPAPASNPSAAARPGPVAEIQLQRRVDRAKTLVAASATLLLLGAALARRLGAPAAWQRQRDALLLGLGLTGGLLWWNGAPILRPYPIHPYEFYHYYFGAKYFPELGYTRLYLCTLVADQDAGRIGAGTARLYRDLETNEIQRLREPLDREPCTRHFTPARWQAFTRDLGTLRASMSPSLWEQLVVDHGYNATPVWGVFGSTLANTGPASTRQFLALRLLDPILLIVMWGAVGWVFGWRVACVGLVFWGCFEPSDASWTGGAYLRQLSLASAMLGICLLARGRAGTAGFLLTGATLLRIFPGLLVAGVALGAGAGWMRAGRPRGTPPLRRFAAGCVLALGILVPLSGWVAGGLDAWGGFARNSRLLVDTPLLNHMGLRSVLAYDASHRAAVAVDSRLEDPYRDWKASRRRAFAAQGPLFAALAVGFVGILAWAVRRQPLWVAAVLGLGLIPVATELTGYYYAFLLGYAFLTRERPGLGAALCGLALLSRWIADTWSWQDEVSVWTSVAVLAFVLLATLLVGLSPRRPAPSTP